MRRAVALILDGRLRARFRTAGSSLARRKCAVEMSFAQSWDELYRLAAELPPAAAVIDASQTRSRKTEARSCHVSWKQWVTRLFPPSSTTYLRSFPTGMRRQFSGWFNTRWYTHKIDSLRDFWRRNVSAMCRHSIDGFDRLIFLRPTGSSGGAGSWSQLIFWGEVPCRWIGWQEHSDTIRTPL
jgi:hypothetical protein